jgi:hypothetical protein
MGTGALSPRIKRPGLEADHYLQLVPRLRKCGSIHPLPHTSSWHSAELVKYTDNLLFYLYRSILRRTGGEKAEGL